MSQDKTIFKDLLGREIKIGDYVIFSGHYTNISLDKVIRFGKKMVILDSKVWAKHTKRYPDELIVTEDPKAKEIVEKRD